MARFLALLLVLLAGPAFAQSAFAQASPAQAVVQTDNVRSELVSEVATVKPGEPFWVGLRQTLRPKWHTYWKNPGDSGLPTTLQWTLPTGVQAGPIEWPTPKRLPIGPLVNYGGHLTVRAVKLYADGALGSRGAALLAPYSDDPGNSGLMLATTEHLQDVATRARKAGFQVNTHAIGDRGVRNVIDAYSNAGVVAKDRFRIEHLQVIAPADVPRLVQHGIIGSMQPTHATSDMYWAEARLGAERAKGAYAWRTVLNAGGRLALGSDFPVESVNPFFRLLAAVTRQDQKGWPEGGWHPTEKLTLVEAIRGFTSDAAYAAFEETSRGTIEVGKLADFTIVDGDLFAMPANDLYKTKVRHTVVGGEVVYTAP